MGNLFSYSKPKELKSKYYPELFESLPKMEGKVVAVTGCTTGTGFAMAKACAQKGATVAMLNRASERADAAFASVQEVAAGGKVVNVACDLMSFSSVTAAAEELNKEFNSTGIDVLCNNAGIMAMKDEATVDGCDVQMQVNHLSHFLLTKEVFPLLETAAEKRGEARIVNHSSLAAKGPPLEAKYLGKNGGNLGGDAAGMMPFTGPMWERYHQTKLANIVFTYALADMLKSKSSKIKAFVAHPGVAATNLQVTTIQTSQAMGAASANAIVSQSAEDGACGILVCGCKPGVNSGEYYGPTGMGLAGKAELMPEEPLANEAARKMLWEESENSTGVKFV